MSRIEYMSELRALLTELSVEEREEALQYYNDYFDDAGVENEQNIIKELGSPAKLAITIKAGLSGTDDEENEYRETGYTNTRFETKETPSTKDGAADGYHYSDNGSGENKPWSNGPIKVILIILIVIIGIPTVIPLAFGILAAIMAIMFAVAALFVALFAVGGALAISGIVMACFGFVQLFHSIPVALGLMGAGLLLTVIGILLAVFMIWMLVKLTPPVLRWFVNFCRKPFQKRKVNEE